MGFNSLQVCMDSSDWFQGTIEEESGMDSSTSPSGEILTCGSRPLMERRLRPQPDQALKCPRCESTHTKFCYYNNYSLSQPRYFCKTCRRYWTKGGTLRNIPVGGGCRKNNKKLSKKPNPTASAADPPPPSLIPPHQYYSMNPSSLSSSHNNISSSSTDLHLSFNNHLPHEVHLSHHHLNGAILGAQGTLAAAATASASFMDNKFGIGMLENHPPHLHSAARPIDFMESKFEAIVEGSRNYDFMGNGEFGSDHHLGNNHGLALAPNFHGFCSPYNGVSLSSLDGNGTGTFMETCQRLMHTYENNDDQNNHIDVKPNAKLLSLEWQDQGCPDNGKDTFGYINNSMGSSSWGGMINGYGPSTTNPLV